MKKIFTYADINVPVPKSLMFFIRLEGCFLETFNMLYIGKASQKISMTQTLKIHLKYSIWIFSNTKKYF